MATLGKLEKVDLRKVWKHEARDFSTWLVQPENLDLLGAQLGIDIEPIGTEIEVGRFRIDILAKEPNTDEKIIIENQLESTNHDHLGKVITYAAGLDARYLIWIVKDVLPEHLKAIEWLNEHLDETVRCFLVKIEIWQIGDSHPAPRFEIISVKNDWAATIRKTTGSAGLSAVRLRQQDFWIRLCAFMKSKDPSVRLHTPRPQGFLDFGMGSPLAHVVLVINTQKNRFSAELYINDDKNLCGYLQSREDEIRSALGADLDWFEGNVASGLKIFMPVGDIFDSSRELEYFEWLNSQVIHFKKVFKPLIIEYLNQNID